MYIYRESIRVNYTNQSDKKYAKERNKFGQRNLNTLLLI